MNNNNTTKKGDVFEERVFKLVNQLVVSDNFFVNSKTSKVYWKKKYYSEKRKGDIEIDISIETFLNGADDYSLLTLIECKNYETSVPINDVREFDSILNEIGEHNTKGIIIAKNSFQKGTLDYAKSSKIGLARVTFGNELNWIVLRKNKKVHSYDYSQIEKKLYDDKLGENNFFALSNNKPFDKLPDLLLDLKVIDKFSNHLRFIRLPYLTEEQIENKVKEIPQDIIYNNQRLNSNALCSYIEKEYGTRFFTNEILNENVLGKTCFNPDKIFINKNLKQDIYRWRFTLAHEVGHLILHKNILSEFVDETVDENRTIAINNIDFISANKRLEIQANVFASRLLINKNYLLKYVNEFFKEESINKGYLYFDHQPRNQDTVFRFLRILQEQFEVSLEVAKYRLISLGLLIDETDNSIKGLLKKQFKPSG